MQDVGLLQFKNEEPVRGMPVAGVPTALGINLFSDRPLEPRSLSVGEPGGWADHHAEITDALEAADLNGGPEWQEEWDDLIATPRRPRPRGRSRADGKDS